MRMVSLRESLLLFLLPHLLACQSSQAPEAPPSPPPLPDRALITIDSPGNTPAVVTDYLTRASGNLISAFNDFERARQTSPRGEYPEWRWTTKFGTWDLTIYAKIVSDDQVAWHEIVDFNEPGRNTWKRWEGTLQSGGASGTLEFFGLSTQQVETTTSWARDAAGDLNVSSQFYELPTTESRQLLAGIAVQADGAVSMLIELAPTGPRIFEAAWDGSGAGSWVSYDAVFGQQIDSGSWH